MFPGRNEPYLKRVSCVELDMLSLAGRADSGILTEMQVNARAVRRARRTARERQRGARATSTQRRRGDALSPAARTLSRCPSSSRRGDVLRYLAAMLGLGSRTPTR